MRLSCIALATACALGWQAGLAAPSVSNTFALRTQNSANSSNFATGDLLYWGADVSPADTSYGFTRQCPIGATCANLVDPPMVRQALFWRDFSLRPNEYFASRPYDASLTAPWTLVLSSDPGFPRDSRSIAVTTPAVGNAALMPFLQSMSASGAGVTPTFSWSLPPSAPLDQVRVFVFDESHPEITQSRSPAVTNSFAQANLIYLSPALSPGQTSYQIPSSAGLQFGTHYSVGIAMEHLRPGSSGAGTSSVDTRSFSYFEFTPLDLPGAPNVYLPATTPVPTTSGLVAGPVYSFSGVPAAPDTVSFIDPFVATGFDYATGAGDPNFASVLLPANVGDGMYDLFTWNGHDYIDSGIDIAGGSAFSFLGLDPAGLSRFGIRGIETSAGVSPFDLTAFVTGFTFVSPGTFNGTMEAVVVNSVPEPQTGAMLLAGLALLGFGARRRPLVPISYFTP